MHLSPHLVYLGHYNSHVYIKRVIGCYNHSSSPKLSFGKSSVMLIITLSYLHMDPYLMKMLHSEGILLTSVNIGKTGNKVIPSQRDFTEKDGIKANLIWVTEHY